MGLKYRLRSEGSDFPPMIARTSIVPFGSVGKLLAVRSLALGQWAVQIFGSELDLSGPLCPRGPLRFTDTSYVMDS